MGSETKQILRAAAMVVLGLALGSVIVNYLPEFSDFLRGSVRDFVRGIFTASEARSFALTLGLIAVCSLLVACCYLIEIGALLIAGRKLRRDESTERTERALERLLNAVGRIADPLSLGALGGIVIAVVAFEERLSAAFASQPWAGPAVVIGVLVAAFIKTSLKKKVIDRIKADQADQGEQSR